MPEPSVLDVSVVIPAFRRPDEVRRAVRSVLAQRPHVPAEIIVVDDASGDETPSAAAEAGATVVVHEHNRGEGASRNSGLRAARHDWVALLDSDDEWLPGHLAALWPLRGDHVMVAGTCLTVGTGPKAGRLYGWHGDEPRVLSSPDQIIWPENTITPSAAMLRRDTALDAGGFPENRRLGVDIDLWIRLLERGTAVTSPEIGVHYHLHESQISAARTEMFDAVADVAASYADRPWFDRRTAARLAALHAWDRRDRPAIARAVARPAGAVGLARALVWRRAKRRAAARRREAVDAPR